MCVGEGKRERGRGAVGWWSGVRWVVVVLCVCGWGEGGGREPCAHDECLSISHRNRAPNYEGRVPVDTAPGPVPV